ncbi:MAG: tyrosine-type recombinase/integrase [Fodinibius sp.]|nr:tyrosine-type recombinase/integrase [Fodinibius sp.]
MKFKKKNRLTGEAGLSHNSAVKSAEYLKSIYRKAQKRYRNIHKDNPFFYFEESPKATKTEYLDKDQLKEFMEIEPDSRNSELVQDMFIFAVYACGMRFSDVFKVKWNQIDFTEQVVKFVPYKTRGKKQGKMINPICKIELKILEKYKNDKEYVFDWANDTSLPIDTIEGLYKLKRSCSVINRPAIFIGYMGTAIRRVV